MAETCVSQTAEYKAAQLGPKKTGTERSVISSLCPDHIHILVSRALAPIPIMNDKTERMEGSCVTCQKIEFRRAGNVSSDVGAGEDLQCVPCASITMMVKGLPCLCHFMTSRVPMAAINASNFKTFNSDKDSHGDPGFFTPYGHAPGCLFIASHETHWTVTGVLL